MFFSRYKGYLSMLHFLETSVDAKWEQFAGINLLIDFRNQGLVFASNFGDVYDVPIMEEIPDAKVATR